jgi:glyoxylase-like metal-dependent hydrolase (beta-lactamase superfamily II)
MSVNAPDASHDAVDPQPDRAAAAPSGADGDRFYFRQLLAGRDFAIHDDVARQMVNFVYLIGDRGTGDCVVVDPAYGVRDLAMVVAEDGMNLTGALITHYHPDHCGGSMMGMRIEGVAELLELTDMPVHVQADEAEWVTKVTDLTAAQLTTHESGDAVMVGEIPIQLLHTPGHTPGSQCFYVNGCLVSGDTLFLDGCGRTDLPGGDPEALYYSLTQTLSQVPDDAVLFPGHMYSQAPAERLGDTRSRNVVFRPGSVEQWMMMFG